MRVVVIKEKRLAELVEAMLDKLRADSGPANTDTTATLSYRRVHYDVHVLLDKIRESEI